MGDFKIIGLRTHAIGSNKKAQDIYKILKPDTDYFFYQGYEVSGHSITPKSDAGFDLYGDGLSEPRINLCAVVGGNGSGKSALVELMLRVINNFACCIIGEGKRNSAAENLIFVEHVYATLYFLKDGVSYALEVSGRSVVVHETPENGKGVSYDLMMGQEMSLPPYAWVSKTPKQPTLPIPNNGADFVWYGIGDAEKETIHLQRIFYTVVNNFSYYAYNADDFSNENCTKNKIKEIRRLSANPRGTVSADDCCWLKGVFHKNDGYVTPVVLSPFRRRGNVDINDERHFAKQRLLWLSLYSKKGENDKQVFPFRTIDDKQVLARIDVRCGGDDYATTEKTIKSLGLNYYTTKEQVAFFDKFDQIRDRIFAEWIDVLDGYRLGSAPEAGESAWWFAALKNYITSLLSTNNGLVNN